MAVLGKKTHTNIREIREEKEYFEIGEMFYVSVPNHGKILFDTVEATAEKGIWCTTCCGMYDLCHKRTILAIQGKCLRNSFDYPIPACSPVDRKDGSRVYFNKIEGYANSR